MTDPRLQEALKWSIENSSASKTAEGGPRTELSQEALAALFDPQNYVSPRQEMRNSLSVVQNKEASLENRLMAFGNFEMLVESLDNANLLEGYPQPKHPETRPDLWAPLVQQLEDENADIRGSAATCCGIAVGNNINTQQQLLSVGAVPVLVRLATEDPDQTVRKRAITALSSTVRNFQLGLDTVVSLMPARFKPQEKLDASDMESVDVLINRLRESLA